MKKIFMVMVLFFLLGPSSFLYAVNKELQLTTYYPAPFGEYTALRLFPEDAHSAGDACPSAEEGWMSYDLSAHKTLTCDGTHWLSMGDGNWPTSGDDIQNSNPGNVGIGAIDEIARRLTVGDPDNPWQADFFQTSHADAYLTMGASNAYAEIQGYYWVDSVNQGPRRLILQPEGGNVGIGTTNLTGHTLYVNGTGYLGAASWDYASDQRLKENISYIPSGIDVIEQLKPVKFDYIRGEKKQTGFIAQEVQEVLPDIVTEGADGMLGMKTESIIPYLVKALQEQQQQINLLEKEITGLKEQQRS